MRDLAVDLGSQEFGASVQACGLALEQILGRRGSPR